jgi:hypothetical protein
MAAGCGAASSWGCAAAEVSRFPTECAGDALAQFDGNEPDKQTLAHVSQALTVVGRYNNVFFKSNGLSIKKELMQ